MSRHVCISNLKMKQTGDPTIQVCWPCCWTSSTYTQCRYNCCCKINESDKIDPHKKETEVSLHQFSPSQAGNISLQANVFYADTGQCKYPLPCPPQLLLLQNTEHHGLWHIFLHFPDSWYPELLTQFSAVPFKAWTYVDKQTLRVNQQCLRWGEQWKKRLRDMVGSFKA